MIDILNITIKINMSIVFIIIIVLIIVLSILMNRKYRKVGNNIIRYNKIK